MGAIANDWLEPLRPEFSKPYYASLYQKVMQEYKTRLIFPPAGEIQGDFHLVVVHAVRVGIFGGDDEHERCAVFLVGMEPEFDGVVRSGPISWKFCGAEGGGLGVLPSDGGGNTFADNGRVRGATIPNGGVLCVNQQPWRHFRLRHFLLGGDDVQGQQADAG